MISRGSASRLLFRIFAPGLSHGDLSSLLRDYFSSGSSSATELLGRFGRGLTGAGFQAKGSRGEPAGGCPRRKSNHRMNKRLNLRNMRTVPPETYHRLGVVSRKFSCEADRDVSRQAGRPGVKSGTYGRPFWPDVVMNRSHRIFEPYFCITLLSNSTPIPGSSSSHSLLSRISGLRV